MRAVTGPTTAVQPFGPFCQAVNWAVVARDDDATTVITWVEAPGLTPSGSVGRPAGTGAGGAAVVAGARGAAEGAGAGVDGRAWVVVAAGAAGAGAGRWTTTGPRPPGG